MGDIFSDFYNFILIFRAGEKVNEKWRRTAHGSDILKRKGYHENQCIEVHRIIRLMNMDNSHRKTSKHYLYQVCFFSSLTLFFFMDLANVLNPIIFENFGEVEKVLVISDGGGSRRTNGARALQRSGHPARCEGSYSEDRCGAHRPRDDPGKFPEFVEAAGLRRVSTVSEQLDTCRATRKGPSLSCESHGRSPRADARTSE
jgi:hypothetical protein